MPRFQLICATASVLVLFSLPAAAQDAPDLSLQLAGEGFSRPVFVTAPTGATGRVFVVEQHTGKVRILDLASRAVQPGAFLTISGITKGGEQGLLGLAFHPGYATNGFLYVNYTTTGGGPAGHSEITRYRAAGDLLSATNADPASKAVLLTYDQPEENHNAGWLAFGPDGYLYISTGDGGGGNDRHGPIGNGQNRDTLLGKILRIDVDQGAPYSIPAGNPFKGIAGEREEIWAFGLRNPWRCSFDRLNGDLWIGDVGQSAREEIDLAPAGQGGLNFGWRPREGAIQNSAYPSETPVTPATEPVYDYGRSAGYSVTGGYVYRGQAIPELQGAYIFGDYGSGRFWSLRPQGTTNQVEELTAALNSGSPKPISGLSSFGEDASGELYVCDLEDGEIYRIISSRSASLQLAAPTVVGNSFQFQFAAVPAQTYTVEARAALTSGTWSTVTNLTATGIGTNLTFSEALDGAQRFYRVRGP